MLGIFFLIFEVNSSLRQFFSPLPIAHLELSTITLITGVIIVKDSSDLTDNFIIINYSSLIVAID